MRDAKSEIESLRSQLNKAISESITLKRDAETMAANLYLRKKCDGLSEANKMRVYGILEGEKDAKVIDEKFDFIVKNILENVAAGVAGAAPTEPTGNPEPLGDVKTDVAKATEKECVCPKCKKVIAVDSHTACSMLKCADCDETNLVDKSNEEENTEPKKDEVITDFGISESAAAKAAKLYAALING